MGCDIHLYTEVKKEVNDQLIWINMDNWKVNPDYGQYEGELEYEINPMYSKRNYTLFTLLAQVRDYSGKTKSVSIAKGLPEDISKHTKAEAEKWDGDGHTHSYLTLGELKRFQATQPEVTYSGMVSPQQAKDLDENNIHPESWCQWTSRKDHVKREWVCQDNSLLPIIEELERRMKDEFWIWNSKEYDVELEEKVRIVFWFDN